MTVITVDGNSVQLPDSDTEDEVVDVEKAPKNYDNNLTSINQNTELEGSLKELNADSINPETRMSQIDMRTRLMGIEISAVLAVDSLVALGVLPQKCLPLSTQKKRLNVSMNGEGRKEMVELVAGKRENDAKAGFGGKMQEGFKNFMGGGK